MEYTSKVVISYFASTFFLQIGRNIHVAQNPPENYLDKIQEFVSYNIKLRAKIVMNCMQWQTCMRFLYILNMTSSTDVETIGSTTKNLITRQEN